MPDKSVRDLVKQYLEFRRVYDELNERVDNLIMERDDARRSASNAFSEIDNTIDIGTNDAKIFDIDGQKILFFSDGTRSLRVKMVEVVNNE